MKKTIYLVRGQQMETYGEFKDRIHKFSRAILNESTVETLRMVLTEEAPPTFSVIPFKKGKIASVSVVSDKELSKTLLDSVPGFSGAFEVIEALPVSYSKDWEDGEVTPGVCLLTLFRQKRSIDHETFIDRWHNSHTPLSLKLHPLWNYNRNVVKKSIKDSPESWDGIVEEHCRTRSDLLNPFKFFGDPVHIIPNMISVYLDTKSFLDYGSIEPYLAMEYHLKS